MIKKILVTGCSGFIGQALCIDLINSGFRVIGYGKTPPRFDQIEFIHGDILDCDVLKSAAKEVDAIIHLAAVTAHNEIVNYPLKTLNVNLQGTVNIAEAFLLSEAKVLIYSSTGKVYGYPSYLPYNEEHPTRPSTILGKTKLLSENVLEFCSFLEPNKSVNVLRIFQVYGKGQRANFLIPTILSQLNKTSITLGDIDAKRDYIFLDDVVEAFNAVLKKAIPGFNLYNLGSGKSYSAKEIVYIISKIINSPIEIEVDLSRFRKGEYDDERTDTGKLERLGWQCRTSIEIGLRYLLTDEGRC